MVISCAAYGCTNRQRTGEKLQFHRFPLNNPSLLKLWMAAVRRKNWYPTKYSCLCGDHFTSDCYTSDDKRFLKCGAVPSLFNFPSHLQKQEKQRRLIVNLDLNKKCPSSEAGYDRDSHEDSLPSSKRKKTNEITEWEHSGADPPLLFIAPTCLGECSSGADVQEEWCKKVQTQTSAVAISDSKIQASVILTSTQTQTNIVSVNKSTQTRVKSCCSPKRRKLQIKKIN